MEPENSNVFSQSPSLTFVLYFLLLLVQLALAGCYFFALLLAGNLILLKTWLNVFEIS